MDADTFLLEDYKLKVGYLTAHLQRMWTRFNFFVTIESGLVAFLFTSSRELTDVAIYFACVGAILAVIWYIFGAQDRFLVLIYREQIKDTADQLLKQIRGAEGILQGYRYVSETEETAKRLKEKMSTFQWRSESFSITRLASLFPLFVLILWLVVIGALLF